MKNELTDEIYGGALNALKTLRELALSSGSDEVRFKAAMALLDLAEFISRPSEPQGDPGAHCVD